MNAAAEMCQLSPLPTVKQRQICTSDARAESIFCDVKKIKVALSREIHGRCLVQGSYIIQMLCQHFQPACQKCPYLATKV